jgi:hypothetical protein
MGMEEYIDSEEANKNDITVGRNLFLKLTNIY